MLTIAEVKNAKPRETEYLLADGRGGLYLRVKPSGHRAWIYKYSINGSKKKINLGLYPDVGLADARELHSNARQLVRRGIDPAIPPPPEITVEQTTVEALIKLYINGSGHLSAKTLAENKRTLEKYVLPIIGQRPAKDIRRPDAIALVERYTDTPGQARAVMKIARAMFTWGLHREYVDFNPFAHVVAAVPVIKARSKTRALDDEEIKHVWKALLAEKDPRSLSTRRALMMILVTGQRPEEVTSSTFDEITVGVKNKSICKICRHCGWWTIPWERIKTRNQRKVNHRVYLPALALEIVSNDQGGPVYPNARGTALARHALSHYVDDHKCWGLDKWTPHDLRRTAATGLSRIGCPDEVIDAILNHAKKGIIGVYNQNKHDKEKEIWLTAWSEHLKQLIRKAPPAKSRQSLEN